MSTLKPSALMWAEARRVIERAERLHQRFFELSGATSQPCWEPPVDMVETEAGLFIEVALPGVDPDRIDARFEGGVLVLAAERDLPLPPEPAVVRRPGLPYGRFERRISLPGGSYELARQQLVNGCLQLALRKLG